LLKQLRTKLIRKNFTDNWKVVTHFKMLGTISEHVNESKRKFLISHQCRSAKLQNWLKKTSFSSNGHIFSKLIQLFKFFRGRKKEKELTESIFVKVMTDCNLNSGYWSEAHFTKGFNAPLWPSESEKILSSIKVYVWKVNQRKTIRKETILNLKELPKMTELMW